MSQADKGAKVRGATEKEQKGSLQVDSWGTGSLGLHWVPRFLWTCPAPFSAMTLNIKHRKCEPPHSDVL